MGDPEFVSKKYDPLAPTYNFLGAITGSIRVESEIGLFIKKGKSDLDQRLVKCFKVALEKRKLSEFLINDLSQFASSFETLSQISNSSNQEYSLPWIKTDILTFEGDLSNQEFEDAWKSDWIRLLSSKKSAVNGRISNEWAITNVEPSAYDQDWKVAYDLLLLLGLRRSHIFTFEMATRVFNISLPIGRLKPVEKREELTYAKKRYQDEVGNYLVLPIISLNGRVTKNISNFRNTLAVSLLLVPVNNIFSNKRKVSPHEMHHVYEKTEFELIDSPLKKFLKSGAAFEGLTLSNFLRHICLETVEMMNVNEESIEIELSNILPISMQITEAILSPNVTDSNIEEFQQESVATELFNDFRNIITPHQSLDDVAFAYYPNVADFRKMSITDNLKLDSNYMTFYNRQRSRLIIFHGINQERFPQSSIFWSLSWGFYMNLSVSVLKAMIHSFYHEISSSDKRQVKTLMKIESDLIEDIDEFYDLDLRISVYKEMYEKIRRLDGVNKDFRMLKEKLGSLKTNLVLEEQTKVNSRILLLTGVSTVSAIASLIILAPEIAKLLNI